MSRSTDIYVVTARRHVNAIVAAFTVKHEMRAWLARHPDLYVFVWRVADGGTRKPTIMTEEELA